MTSTTDTLVKTGKKSRPSKRRTKFQRLWDEAETLRTENDKLEQQLESLLSRFKEEVLPAELEMGKLMREVVHKQLEFTKRKTLAQWQRQELELWITENIDHLFSLGLVDSDLRNSIAEKVAREFDIDLDSDSEQSAAEQLETHLNNSYDSEHPNSDNGPDNGSDDLFDSDPDDTSEFNFEEILQDLYEEFEQTEKTSQSERHNADKPASIDKSVFQRLFRQTANALHPDKEPDPKKQQEKHELMAQLLKARTEHDLATLLQLHQQHASADSELSQGDQQQLIGVLQRYLDEQLEKRREILNRNPMSAPLFGSFHSKDPASTDKLIAKQLKLIKQNQKSLQYFLDKVNTLTTLKDLLAARYDESVFDNDWF